MLIKSALLSALPEVRHGFSTRLGGISKGPYATFNLARDLGDDDAAVTWNLRHFKALARFDPDKEVTQLIQRHGNTVRTISANDARHAEDIAEGDALITFDPNTPVGIRTADCTPILVACLDRTEHRVIAVAAIHAGWRSATANIVARTLEALEAGGAERGHMRAAVGPTIGPRAFEVGEEVIEAARQSLGGRAPPMYTAAPASTVASSAAAASSSTAASGSTTASERPHLDLPGLVVAQLLLLGFSEHAIDAIGHDTFSERALFFSHRRDAGVTGRQLSAIAFGSR
ncbi:MAG: laccase domain-containing protein [Deltaproteobacteria bacterium]|nr:laccase domain-containing protein [Deltaproteobacteria bacterium]